MSDPLNVDDCESLRTSLIRMGLVGADEYPALTPLTGGVSSQIVRADTARGTLCLKRALSRLKVAADWQAPLERSEAEVAWLRTAARLLPDSVPRVLGEDKAAKAFAMEFLDPARYPVWKQSLRDGTIDDGFAAEVGRRLAALHGATANSAFIAQTFQTDASFYALRLEPYFLATALAHPDCADALYALIEKTARAHIAMVHGDVSPKNILVGENGPVFLDAECAWYGDPAFDIAFCLTHLLLKSIWRPSFESQYLSSFAALADAYFEGVTWESVASLDARAAAILAALLLARIDGKSPVEYLTNEADKQQVRDFARPLVAAAPCSVREVAQRWIQRKT
jgi:aminoglycoside phosphotransferase (APT) family kinase protein